MRSIVVLTGLLIAGAGLLPVAAQAQELSAMAGVMGSGAPHGTSYAWELQYRHRFLTHLAWSAAWINEGHTASHHRDGLALQVWGLVLDDPDDFSLAIGAGEYRFADTHFLAGDGYRNDHGWTPIFSLQATYYLESPWFLQLTGNHINSANGLHTNSLVAGIGYQLGWKHSDTPRRRERAANTLTVMAGRTIVNSRSSESASAKVIEYRRGVATHFDWTLSLMDEGDPEIMHRQGAATQLWLMDSYLHRRLGLGLGAGPYFVFQRKGPPTANSQRETATAALLSPTISYQLGSHWQARLTWNRVLSKDNRDADVIVAGLGYRWGTR
jgi:hypothetical protein